MGSRKVLMKKEEIGMEHCRKLSGGERELFICVYNHTILLKQQSSLGEHTHRYAFLNEHAFIDIKGIVVEGVSAEREQNHCYCIELQTIKAIHMEIE